MNFEPDPALAAFRDEVRAFLRDALPPALARRGRSEEHTSELQSP